MERQAQDSEVTPRVPRQYQADVREASVDEAVDNDLYGDGHQHQSVPSTLEDEQVQEAESPQWIAGHVTEEPIDLAQELQSTDSEYQAPTTTRNNDVAQQEIVYLCDHRGFRSVFPFEQCSSRDATVQLWEEMYAKSDLNHEERQSYLDKLVNGEYRIETLDGVSIPPHAWKTTVRPKSTIKIVFNDRPRSRSRRQSRLQPDNTSRLEPEAVGSSQDLTVSIEVLGSASSSSESESSIITEDEYSENETSSSEDDTPVKDVPLLQPNHFVQHPVDVEGNKLSFEVKTKRISSIVTPSDASEDPEVEKKEPVDSNLEIRRITKAMAMDSDAKDMLTLHTLPSLANPRLRASVTTTWYHLQGSHLDFDHFEKVSLAIPHLSDRLQTLTREVLKRLRDDRIKPFVGGQFIEPGTVLRADESDTTDSQSVIFSCIPYFSLQQAAKPSPAEKGLSCPPRTLMQALYPYESVRERDEEQSYRRFDNDSTNNIVHVPSLWIMNIGSTAVVTYGHEPLPVAMKTSVRIVEEDIRHLGKLDVTQNALTKIHITDRGGSSLIYPISMFRSFFELESRIVHSNPSLEGSLFGRGIKLKVHNLDEGTMARPGNWRNIVSRAAQLVSINITIPDDQKGGGRDEEPSSLDPAVASSSTSVPPFFHWEQSKTNDLSHKSGKPVLPGTSEKDRSIVCLEYVEKIMMSRYLVRSSNALEDAFTSTNYYHFLPETMYGGVTTRMSELQDLIDTNTPPDTGSINHRMIVRTHCRGILVQSVAFLETVQKTLNLFVDDLDSSSILRKLSSALQNVHQQVVTIEQRGSLEPDPDEYTNSKWEHPEMMNRAWSIRTSAWEVPSSLPESRKLLRRSILRCRRCRGPFKSAISAMTHLVRHVKKYSTGNKHSTGDVPSYEELQDWIINSVQYRRELTNASALVILTHASEIAEDLFIRARELAEGVQNEDGKMSALYTLPQELINVFRRIVMFYLVIERALHENEKAYGQDVGYQSSPRLTNYPYSVRDVDVLERFGGYARRSLCKARILLCEMVRPEEPLSLRKHLSLGPEYVCLWLIRRLLMMPLEQSKSIGDMYHVYVSKVQFEINHRPSKRLLRAINLIQEELEVLQTVNTWQANLVRNYLEVLDDFTYEKIMPSRRAMYLYEYALGMACLDHLSLVRQDYADLIRRCAPLSDRTKQILEINEEDHGKAIMVFTIVTVIFLPLSFVTSYFGMNASDIRDMSETQAVFWSVAIPLTCVTVGSCLLVGYNGDSIRDLLSSMYRKLMGKERDNLEAAGMTVSQRQGPSKSQGGLDSVFDSFGPEDDEFPTRRRGLYGAGYDLGPDADESDEWYEREGPVLDKVNLSSHSHNTSTFLSHPRPSGIATKRKSSYPNPASVAIQRRRQSLYPYSYPPDRPPPNIYNRSPRVSYREVARDRPHRARRAKSGYTNSINHTNLYGDGDSRTRLADYGGRGSSIPHYHYHVTPPQPFHPHRPLHPQRPLHPIRPFPPSPLSYPQMVTHTTRSRRRTVSYDDDDGENEMSDGDRRRNKWYGHGREKKSRDRSRSRSRERDNARNVHYGETVVERNRNPSPVDTMDLYD